jgi:hypothetical protein
MKAYENTNTSVTKSQEDIRWILSKYGAGGVQFSENWEEKFVMVRFYYKIAERGYTILFKVPIPQVAHRSPKGRIRTQNQIETLQKQFERGIWRAIFWAIKSRMEAVEFGIESFQEAFLSHFEVPGTDKQIGDILIPRLISGNLMLEH